MRLSTRIHGIVDYLVGGLLVVLAVLSGHVGEPAGLSLIGGGIVVIATAAVTDFEAGVLRRLQIPVHLWVDGIVGLLLAVSPWLLVFYEILWLTHVAFGILLVGVAFFTHTVPGYERRRSGSVTA
jgi:hypothetical protein